MKRLLFLVLILASGAHALPKKSLASLFASMGASGLAWYFSSAASSSYAMKKEQMVSKKIDVPQSTRPVNFEGYHVAINAHNDIYDYKLSLADVNLGHAAQEIGQAYIACTRASVQQTHECTLERLHIDKNYRYGGSGSLLLQEAVADLKKRTSANELDLFARAEQGTSQSRLEHFYKKNGGKRKDDPYMHNVFVFNLRNNKI